MNHDHVVFLKRMGFNSVSTNKNGNGIRIVKGKYIFMWYPLGGSVIVQNTNPLKTIGQTHEVHIAVQIINSYA